MLESALGTDVLACCLSNPESAVDIVKSNKDRILKQDFDLLISTSSSPALWLPVLPSVSPGVTYGTQHCKGVKGTRTLQSVFKELSRLKSVFICSLCAPDKIREPSCFKHICEHHSDQIGELNCSRLFDCLEQANSDFILNTCVYMSKCNSLWSINYFYPLR